ncbi:MAG: hypothetical protein JWM99_3136, partial [Verrucomicrobiales bacterium]|nr:hypothetical protein [Verrucomicrobiales bacterium]
MIHLVMGRIHLLFYPVQAGQQILPPLGFPDSLQVYAVRIWIAVHVRRWRAILILWHLPARIPPMLCFSGPFSFPKLV